MNNKGPIIGKYEYSKWTFGLAAAMLISGVFYGIVKKKGGSGIFLFGVVGMVTGFAIGSIIQAPKRIAE